MIQQINLYQPMFRRQEKVFSAMTMLQTVLLFTGLLTAIYFYGQYRINPLENQLDRAASDVARLGSQVEKYRNEVTEQGESKLLEDEIARMEQELERRRKVRDLLEVQQIGNRSRFSDLMEALARQHIEGTWLTEIEISAAGKALSLNGKTLSSRLVPRYMQQLGEESVMKGIAFNSMELQRPERDADGVDNRAMLFHISTN